MSSPVPWNDARGILTAANLGVPIEWPNEPFVKPEPPGLWISVRMTCMTLSPIELSGGAWQEDGQLYCAVIAPAGSGTAGARALAKTVVDLFRGLGARPVVYHDASIGEGRTADTAGMWWALDCTVAYRYQDISQ